MLNAKDVFTQAAVFERAFGWSIIIVGYQDRSVSIAEPVKMPEKIATLEAFAPPMMVDVQVDKDPQSARFGLPEIYKLRVESETVEVHYSRVIHIATRLFDHPWKGMSVLEPVWDDLTVLRNIRWSMGQTMYRYGSGFPVVTVKGATKEEVDRYKQEWGPLTAQTSMWCDENTTIEFKGL
ncbi:MAG: DUF1073 domain-containing protein, partial [Candidatus Bathyarchaeia archaeon]|nr:DUF1073 domain-containing protein [Candidatus Bathyarchaeia archaeon]